MATSGNSTCCKDHFYRALNGALHGALLKALPEALPEAPLEAFYKAPSKALQGAPPRFRIELY